MPMKLWCSCRASSWDETTTCRASWVNRSNMPSVPSPERPAAARVLLVHRLPGDAEPLGDLLPRPALIAGVLHLEGLQALDEDPQGSDGLQTHRGVPAAGGRCDLCCVRHGCQLRLLSRACQPFLTELDRRRRSGDGRRLAAGEAQQVVVGRGEHRVVVAAAGPQQRERRPGRRRRRCAAGRGGRPAPRRPPPGRSRPARTPASPAGRGSPRRARRPCRCRPGARRWPARAGERRRRRRPGCSRSRRPRSRAPPRRRPPWAPARRTGGPRRRTPPSRERGDDAIHRSSQGEDDLAGRPPLEHPLEALRGPRVSGSSTSICGRMPVTLHSWISDSSSAAGAHGRADHRQLGEEDPVELGAGVEAGRRAGGDDARRRA